MHKPDCKSMSDSAVRPCTCAGEPMTTPLTREQVEEGDFDRAQIIGLIDTIAQQAQEIERLKLALTAMTTERDEAARQILSLRHEAWGLVEQRNAAQARVKELEEKKDGAYLERNHLVAALARCFPSGIRKTAIEGWSDDWHGCVYIDLSAGQISYHYHDSQAFLFESLPAYTKLYDGHTKDDVHERLQSVNLQATLAAREARVKELEAAHFMELKERLRYTGEYRDAKRKVEQLVTDLDTARQDAARLREALEAVRLCSVNSASSKDECGRIAQAALKGA